MTRHRDPPKLPTAPKEHPKQPAATSSPCQSLLAPSRWLGQQGDGFLADAVKVFTMETGSPASKTLQKQPVPCKEGATGESSMAPAYDPKKFRSAPRGPWFTHLQAVGNSPLPQDKGFPCSCVPGREHPTTARGGMEPSRVLQHQCPAWAHEQDRSYIRDTKTPSFPLWKPASAPTDPTGLEGGRESKAKPRLLARHMHRCPPCTAVDSWHLRGFFLLDNKNKTLLSGSYKNPTEELSPAPSGVLETFLSHWPSAQSRPPGL